MKKTKKEPLIAPHVLLAEAENFIKKDKEGIPLTFLRDMFAGHALQGLLQSSPGDLQQPRVLMVCEVQEITRQSYMLADAMMDARPRIWCARKKTK